MSFIVSIGGGKLGAGETLPIDRHIKTLTGKSRPNALFISTASSDDPGYNMEFRRIYGKKLGCETDVLMLLRRNPSPDTLTEKISRADLIYVGGGNTLKMIRRWRHLGVDRLLYKAWKNGTICAGLSAGALCWFAYGHSDSLYYYNPRNWKYIRVSGLGLVEDITLCPHYDGEKRDQNFRDMILRKGGAGVALDDCCALVVEHNSRYRVLSAAPKAGAYRVYKQRGKVVQEPLPVVQEAHPLSSLQQPARHPLKTQT